MITSYGRVILPKDSPMKQRHHLIENAFWENTPIKDVSFFRNLFKQFYKRHCMQQFLTEVTS